ncbi:MAG: 2-succinyl-5-enolpyruvyl-6-hydroxy-3-cyclohexene-1-carboxylic-acid synthase [Acidimicrobiales bacterium]
MTEAADVQAAFAATLVDEWARGGVTDVVVAPGSRSTPMLVALAAGRLRVQVVLDERSAGFVALGLGLATGRPAVVVTTSGTAAVELHPAVVEAHQAGVPLLAVTADRPAERHRVGAPQTIEQEALFSGALRWSASPGVADVAAAGTWRSLAARSVAETMANPAGPGPVHLNLAFREPLLGSPGVLPAGRDGGGAWHRVEVAARAAPATVVDALAAGAGGRGLVVAGAGSGPSVVALAEALGWPLLADPPSGARVPGRLVVAAADTLLRVPDVAAWRPSVVLRTGRPWASRVLSTWLAGLGSETEQILVDPYGRWADPERQSARTVACDVAGLAAAVEAAVGTPAPPAPSDWARRWVGAEAAAQAAIDEVLGAHPCLTEPAVARGLVAGLAPGSRLFVSSSMPVRDVEWFARPRDGLTVLANRGANGIDGIVSSALGIAAAGQGAVAALVGDLAFLYDAGALLWARERGLDCTLVVVDNDGGGIFSFLPQAAAIARQQFERFWGTPHGVDLLAVARAYGAQVGEVATAAELRGAVAAVGGSGCGSGSGGGVRVLRVRTDRAANVVVHHQIEQAVAAAIGRLPG